MLSNTKQNGVGIPLFGSYLCRCGHRPPPQHHSVEQTHGSVRHFGPPGVVTDVGLRRNLGLHKQFSEKRQSFQRETKIMYASPINFLKGLGVKVKVRKALKIWLLKPRNRIKFR